MSLISTDMNIVINIKVHKFEYVEVYFPSIYGLRKVMYNFKYCVKITDMLLRIKSMKLVPKISISHQSNSFYQSNH